MTRRLLAPTPSVDLSSEEIERKARHVLLRQMEQLVGKTSSNAPVDDADVRAVKLCAEALAILDKNARERSAGGNSDPRARLAELRALVLDTPAQLTGGDSGENE